MVDSTEAEANADADADAEVEVGVDVADRVSITPAPQRIAVVRALRGLGDMLCLVPALRAMRAAWPAAQVTLIGLASARPFQQRFAHYLDEFLEFPGFPGIPEVEVDSSILPAFFADVQGRFDLAIQMHGSGSHSNAFTVLLGATRTAGLYLPSLWRPNDRWYLPYPAHAHEVHRWLELVEFLGARSQGDNLEFPLQPADDAELRAILPAPAEGRHACIHPGAFEPARRWPPERFAAVGDWLAASGLTVFLTGSDAEADLTAAVKTRMNAPAVDLAGRTGLGSLAALLSSAALVVCNDTGVSHLTAAVGTPSVVIFAASEPQRWAPLNRERHRIAGEIMPERQNTCLHTAEVKGHRCLRDGCSSLNLPASEHWQPAPVAEVVALAGTLLARWAPS